MSSRAWQVARSAAASIQEVQQDERARLHDPLSVTQFSILDIGLSSTEVQREISRLERNEQKLRHARQRSPRGWRGIASLPFSCFDALIDRVRHRVWTFTSVPASWAYLVLLGTLTALAAALAEVTVSAFATARATAVAELRGGIAGYAAWVMWCVVLSLASGALCAAVPLAEGSGIPQLKAVLAGTPDLEHFLKPSVGAAKLTGLVLAQGAGLSVGKEGPFVHVAAVIAARLWALPVFGAIKSNAALRRHMLGAAVAAGVTATFGTPIAAVLFGIEVTSSILLVSSLWRSFLCAVVTALVFDVINRYRPEAGFSGTAFSAAELSWETLAFIGLGALCGLLGSASVVALNIARIVRRPALSTPARRYATIAAAAFAVASLTYLTRYTRKGDMVALNDLLSDGSDPSASLGDWSSENPGSRIGALIAYLAVKFTATVISINLPISCGLFSPLLVIGACTGRLVGELLRLVAPSVAPGAYAVVGAAALVSGATGTFSTAIMVFELSGSMSHLLPVLLGTLTAYSVSSVFTVSV